MRRREFITLLSSALAAWPLTAQGQQPLPVVGYLNSGRRQEFAHLTAIFLKGLAEGGFVETQNVRVEYRWAEGDYNRLPALAADLVKQKVSVIVTQGPPGAAEAKSATDVIPIVFAIGDDPVRMGLVSSLGRPGGNVTGVTMVASLVLTKRIGILHQLLPKVSLFAVLVNPNSSLYEVDRDEAKTTARSIGIEMHILEAGSDATLEKAFATATERRIGALVVGADPFFNTRRRNIIEFAAQQKIPTIYPFREFSFAGGLMSYGTTLAFAYHASGLYAARILKGEKPSDLPVLQPTNFEFVLNLKAAKTLGIEVSPNILALADEVIE